MVVMALDSRLLYRKTVATKTDYRETVVFGMFPGMFVNAGD
jgi:hypothetical protein